MKPKKSDYEKVCAEMYGHWLRYMHEGYNANDVSKVLSCIDKNEWIFREAERKCRSN